MPRPGASARAPGPAACLLPASCPQRPPEHRPRGCTGGASSEEAALLELPAAHAAVMFLPKTWLYPPFVDVCHLPKRMVPFLKANTMKLYILFRPVLALCSVSTSALLGGC